MVNGHILLKGFFRILCRNEGQSSSEKSNFGRPILFIYFCNMDNNITIHFNAKGRGFFFKKWVIDAFKCKEIARGDFVNFLSLGEAIIMMDGCGL